MRELIHKAKPIFVILLMVFVLSYAAGYIAGQLNWADAQSLQQSPVLKLSSNLEYKVPGYSQLLKAYKAWHDKCLLGYLFQKNAWELGTLIFINNFFVANLTMFIRALFVLPITLTVFGKFFQGVVFAQVSSSGRMASIFLLEFGGYFLTIGATLNLVFWTILPRAFRFENRKKALISGLKLLGVAYLLSGVAILLGSILETRFILRFFSGSQ